MSHLRSARIWPLVVALVTALGMTLLAPPTPATAVLATTTVSGWSTQSVSVAAGYVLKVPLTVTTGGRRIARTVSVQRKLATATTWTTTSTVTTSSTGYVSVSVLPSTAATYHFRVVALPTATSSGSTSPVRTVVGIVGKPGLYVGWPVALPPTTAGATMAVTAHLRTGTTYLARPIRLQRKLATATTWTTIATGTTASNGAYAATLSTPTAGGWQFRLMAPATSSAAVAYSAVLAVTAVVPVGDPAEFLIPRGTPRDLYRSNWSTALEHFTYVDPTGALVAVSRTGSSLTVRRVDATTYVPLSTQQFDITGWTDLGGVYAAPDGHVYVLLGRENPTESRNLNVVSVRRYDAAWRLRGTAYVTGNASQLFTGIVKPFAASAPDMRLVGSRLVVHMGRSMFAGSDGVRHQSNLTLEVDTAAMVARTFESFAGSQVGTLYSSHSFRQLLTTFGSSLVTVDHGDAYPRGIMVNVIAGYPALRTPKRTVVLPFNGAIGNNFTGATLDGAVSGPSGVLIVGSSIKHPSAPNGALGSASEARNVYAVTFNPTTGTSSLRWVTAYAASATERVGEPQVVPLSSDRFAVLFRVDGAVSTRLEYRLMNSAGTVLASASYPGVDFSAVSRPTLAGQRIVWLSRSTVLDTRMTEVPAYFTALDVSTLTAPAILGR